MSNSATLASSSSPPVIPMVPQLRQLFKACNKGDFGLCNHLIIADPDILFSTTPHKNNCLHIAAMLGHHEFAREVWSRAPSLLSGTNIDGETPLIAALMASNLLLASDIITAASQYLQHNELEEGRSLSHMLLKVDRRNENVLHHAMRNGFANLALQLLEIEPRLSEQVTNAGESPMYMAARRGYSRVIELLLQNPFSVDSGAQDKTAISAAVRFNHIGIVTQLLEARPQLPYMRDQNGYTPLHIAVLDNNLKIVKIFLDYDPNLAYIKDIKTGNSLFITAAQKGFVSIAEEIMRICPDSVYTPDNYGYSALHQAIVFEHPDFFEYILRTPQLHRLINQANNNGSLPLHYAAHKCMPKLLSSLLSCVGLDFSAIDSNCHDAVDVVYSRIAILETLKWNESFTLLSSVIPSGLKKINIARARKEIQSQTTKEVKRSAREYAGNTSLVATLLATITFAAAFTMPGGFSTDPANAGQPLFARRAAFQVFLISDTIAMCSSLTVAFVCILSTWSDLEFLLNYRKQTGVLMWCAYEATVVAFGSGLFMVMASNNLWLAIFILVLCTILTLLPKIISEWPILMLRYRLCGSFRKDLIRKI